MARIWTEDIKTPIMSTRYESSYLTSGIWSPTRPGVFYITKKNGELDIWDYYYKGQFEPAFSIKISEKYSLTDCKISNKSDGKLVGIGCQDGSITILELCKSLYLSNNLNIEKQAITQLFERETNREKTLQTTKLAQRRAAKQNQLKQLKNNNKDIFDNNKKKDDNKDSFDLSDLSQIENDFLSFINKNKPKKPQFESIDDAQNDENDESVVNQ